MNEVRIITNNVPRPVIEAYELTLKEREDFDYLDWKEIDNGLSNAQFFRYKGELHDLGEFSADWGITKGMGLPAHLSKWHGYRSDSFFLAMLVRYVEHYEYVVIGLMLS